LALCRKGSILILSGPVKHLHVVCNDPCFYPPVGKSCVLMVNISSLLKESHFDETCVLGSQDHQFIKHDSYVFYKKADIFGAERVNLGLADGSLSSHASFTEKVFKRILDGFEISDETKPKILRFCKKYC
jgi:hypothetical protein